MGRNRLDSFVGHGVPPANSHQFLVNITNYHQKPIGHKAALAASACPAIQFHDLVAPKSDEGGSAARRRARAWPPLAGPIRSYPRNSIFWERQGAPLRRGRSDAPCLTKSDVLATFWWQLAIAGSLKMGWRCSISAPASPTVTDSKRHQTSPNDG